MSDEKIPSRKGKVTPTEKARRARNKAIIPAMKKLKNQATKNRNEYNKKVKIGNDKRYKQLLNKVVNNEITSTEAAKKMTGEKYYKGLYGKDKFNKDVLNIEKATLPRASLMKKIKTSSKKAGGIIKKDVGGKVIPSRKGKVTPTEKARRARNKAIVPAMKAKKKSLSKINKKKKKKDALHTFEIASTRGPGASKINYMGRVLKSLGMPGLKNVDPQLAGEVHDSPFKDSSNKEFSKMYNKLYKEYKNIKITPKDKESIMKKIKTSSKKAGGGQVKNRNMGGVIGGGLGSQDVVDYLYKYKS